MSRNRADLLKEIYRNLFDAFGHQNWWPAETPFEMILGAILTQNTSWKNVEKAIGNLRDRGLLDFSQICDIPANQLALLIRSSGFFNQKAIKIKTFCNHIQLEWGGDFEKFLCRDAENLRIELLKIRGIGPETADSIVLYAAFQPSFVVDAYTYRIFSRHGWVSEEISYEELRLYFMGSLEPDVPMWQEFHALLVRAGNLYCRKSRDCKPCPLRVYPIIM